MNPKIGQNVVFRLQPMYLEAIRLLALEKHMTPSEYLRGSYQGTLASEDQGTNCDAVRRSRNAVQPPCERIH